MSSHQTKFQATLNMIQTVPRIAESASQLHDDVMLCQLIAGARFGEDAAQDPELVFRLLDHLTERMDSYEDVDAVDPSETGGGDHELVAPASGWGSAEAFVGEGESYEQGEERIAGAPADEPTPEAVVAEVLPPYPV